MASARAIQIVKPVNHKFEFQFEELKPILEADNIKDRHCVIISIAGAFRKGKSFLLNFFLKYLYAKYKKLDVTDWIGENMTAEELNKFASRGGRKPETTGIWMWSDIFTHDFENGDKIAIILLDTQGLFDHQMNVKDCTATFAISMMLASVQCYNVMQNIQEDDLQHLELFTEYGRLALQQTNDKPFQKLLFIVRDWPYAKEKPYGACQSVVKELLAENVGVHTNEMIQLRRQVGSSFDEFGAFLMPYPGTVVAEGQLTDGNVKEIDSRFIDNVKVLVPSLFAPENLIVKKISGQKVRARDLATYMEAYVDVFNSDTLPEPKSVLMATAETSNQILYIECLKLYIDSMQSQIQQKSSVEFEPYFVKSDLKNIHEKAKATAMSQFQKTRKLGGSEMIQTYVAKLESHIQVNFNKFDVENDKKKIDFDIMAEKNIQILYGDCLKIYANSIQKVFNETESFISLDSFYQLHEQANNESLSKFHGEKKLGGQELISDFQRKLETDIANKYNDFKQENDKKKKQFEAMEAAKAKAKAEEEAKILAQKRADEEAARARAEEEAKILAQKRANEEAARARAEAEARALEAQRRVEAEQNNYQLQAANKQLQKEIKEANKGGIFKTIGKIVTTVAGAVVGGPVGAIAGAEVGKKVFDE